MPKKTKAKKPKLRSYANVGAKPIHIGEPMTERIMIRLLPSQLKRWEAAARQESPGPVKMPLGQWIRNAVERALGGA